MNVTDDITTTADGVDTYHLVKSAGRYKSVALCLVLVYFLRSVLESVCYCVVLLEGLVIEINTVAIEIIVTSESSVLSFLEILEIYFIFRGFFTL